MSRYTSWNKEAITQASSILTNEIPQEVISQTPSISSFTPTNKTSSSFQPAPRMARQYSGGFYGGTSQSDDPEPKRRKTEPAILDASKHDTLQKGEENTILGPNQIPNSLHLGAPPKSKLGRKKVAAKVNSASKSLFLDTPRTKSKQPKCKQAKVQSKSNSYHGFITTEDRLKNNVKLGQTTLDTLASFKYNPETKADVPDAKLHVSNTFASDSQSLAIVDYDGEELLPLAVSQARDLEEPDLLDIAPFEDAFFADMNYLRDSPIPNQSNDFNDLQTTIDNVYLDSTAEYVTNVACVSDADFEMHTENETLEYQGFNHQGLIQGQRPIPVLSCDGTGNAGPPSSGGSRVTVINNDPQEASCASSVDDSTQHNQNQFLDGLEFPGVMINVETNNAGPAGSVIPAAHHLASMIGPDLTSGHQQADMDYEAAEFDDNDINDEDLYAMSITNKSGRECKLNAEHSINFQKITVSIIDPAPPQGFSALILDQPVSMNIHQALPELMSNEGSPDTEDEFSIGEAEEEALMQFVIPNLTVHETQTTPSSITFPSEEGESRDFEAYDRHLQYSDPDVVFNDQNNIPNMTTRVGLNQASSDKGFSEENWSFLTENAMANEKRRASDHQASRSSTLTVRSNQVRYLPTASPMVSQASPRSKVYVDPDYLPLKPFARPEFIAPMRDRSPVIGFSGRLVLRTCFRIGEVSRVAAASDNGKYEVLVELFARVTFSSREEGTVKHHFQFADLFHDRPPFLNGILENYKVNDLINTESKQLLGASSTEQLVRCLGRVRREVKGKRVLVIENIRMTDWEEIRRTKSIIEDLCERVKPGDRSR